MDALLPLRGDLLPGELLGMVSRTRLDAAQSRDPRSCSIWQSARSAITSERANRQNLTGGSTHSLKQGGTIDQALRLGCDQVDAGLLRLLLRNKQLNVSGGA